jgi:molybdate transport system substrate-binding protein
MAKRPQARMILACCLALFIACVPSSISGAPRGTAQNSAPTTLTISAAASLADVFNELHPVYEKQHSGVALVYNFGGSGTLQIQIEQGAPVDIFVSAASQEMDALEKKNLLVPDTRVILARNQIVLIVPRDSTGISGFRDLLRPKVRVVALGEPASVPAGHYAQQVLEHLGIYQQVRAKAVFAGDVRQVLAYVETGNADAGIVYATDVQTSKRVRIVADAPAGSHDPVIYPGAVIGQSTHHDAAREFLNFLTGPEARAVFAKYGFAPAAGPSH